MAQNFPDKIDSSGELGVVDLVEIFWQKKFLILVFGFLGVFFGVSVWKIKSRRAPTPSQLVIFNYKAIPADNGLSSFDLETLDAVLKSENGVKAFFEGFAQTSEGYNSSFELIANDQFANRNFLKRLDYSLDGDLKITVELPPGSDLKSNEEAILEGVNAAVKRHNSVIRRDRVENDALNVRLIDLRASIVELKLQGLKLLDAQPNIQSDLKKIILKSAAESSLLSFNAEDISLITGWLPDSIPEKKTISQKYQKLVSEYSEVEFQQNKRKLSQTEHYKYLSEFQITDKLLDLGPNYASVSPAYILNLPTAVLIGGAAGLTVGFLAALILKFLADNKDHLNRLIFKKA